MKRFVTLLCFIMFLVVAGYAAKTKDLSGPMALKGEFIKPYGNYPAGTPVIVRRVVKLHNYDPGQYGYDTYYAIEVNSTQTALPSEELKLIKFYAPESSEELWQQIYVKQHLYEYFSENGYRKELRNQVDEECMDYLDKVKSIAYNDDYINSYVQSVFAKLSVSNIDPNRSERLNVQVIQSPEPEAYMLPNGSMLVSTGLLCTLDSEDELAAIIANEMAHFVRDDQINNIYIAERNAKRAAFWGSVLAATADAAFDVAYWDDNKKALGIGVVASIGSIATLINANVVDRLGMQYKLKQEFSADEIAKSLISLKGMNPDALSSALSKIVDYYERQNKSNNLTRYSSTDDLKKRIEKAGEVHNIETRPYQKTVSDVITFNAQMEFANQRYAAAARLIQKNIKTNLASDNDYVILVKAKMALYNTEESNNDCLSLLQKAKELAGTSPNLDINKQEILLLLRMNKQMQAAGALQDYLTLLTKYNEQGVKGDEQDWATKEIGWAQQLLTKISKI